MSSVDIKKFQKEKLEKVGLNITEQVKDSISFVREQKEYDVVCAGPFGSMNYGVADENSDCDVMVVVVPSLDYIMNEEKFICEKEDFCDGDIIIYDVRKFVKELKKGVLRPWEILFSEWFICDEFYFDKCTSYFLKFDFEYVMKNLSIDMLKGIFNNYERRARNGDSKGFTGMVRMTGFVSNVISWLVGEPRERDDVFVMDDLYYSYYCEARKYNKCPLEDIKNFSELFEGLLPVLVKAQEKKKKIGIFDTGFRSIEFFEDALRDNILGNFASL